MKAAKHRALTKEMGCCCQPCFYAPQQQESKGGRAAGLQIPRGSQARAGASWVCSAAGAGGMLEWGAAGKPWLPGQGVGVFLLLFGLCLAPGWLKPGVKRAGSCAGRGACAGAEVRLLLPVWVFFKEAVQ